MSKSKYILPVTLILLALLEPFGMMEYFHWRWEPLTGGGPPGMRGFLCAFMGLIIMIVLGVAGLVALKAAMKQKPQQ